MFGPFRKVKAYSSPTAANITADAPNTTLGREMKLPSGFMPIVTASVTWRNAVDQSSETATIAAYVPVMVQFDLITADQIILVGWP